MNKRLTLAQVRELKPGTKLVRIDGGKAFIKLGEVVELEKHISPDSLWIKVRQTSGEVRAALASNFRLFEEPTLTSKEELEALYG